MQPKETGKAGVIDLKYVKVYLFENMDCPSNIIMFEREFNNTYSHVVDKEFIIGLKKLR
jgi:hypothetical protein